MCVYVGVRWTETRKLERSPWEGLKEALNVADGKGNKTHRAEKWEGETGSGRGQAGGARVQQGGGKQWMVINQSRVCRNLP